MKALSIRTSLTLWFVVMTGVLLIGFGATLYFGMRATLRTEFDRRLLTRAEALVAVCEWEEDARAVEFEMQPEMAAEFIAMGKREAGSGTFTFEIRSLPEDRILHASDPVLPALAGESDVGASFAFADRHELLRECSLRRTLPTESDVLPAPEVLVRVAASYELVVDQLARVRTIIYLLTAIAVVVVVAFGLFLSRRFVRPLRELGAAASQVGQQRGASMPKRGSDDEVDRLASILDRTFSALEDAAERKARFTADAAHELRNPVSVIRNAAEIALREGRTADEMREFLVDIRTTSKRMGDIVESLLTLARMDAESGVARSEVVDFASIVRDSVTAARIEAPTRIHSDVNAGAFVAGEQNLLRILVDNLIGNALRHGNGSTVHVELGTRDAQRVVLTVTDHGPGIPEELRDAVFRRFHRGNGQRSLEGAGLGLAIVAEVAAAHRATCRIESADPGARVVVELPIADPYELSH
ncbi:MAG: HAMP domain-containing histidine kinase [Planctomycetes bacterium]|nr:HAMP domain-containing histidine kinase [Planctomycetota bacterium]MCB9919506.1 HAMP domain-containing histidine kinase [Planctomycetota bacterium]